MVYVDVYDIDNRSYVKNQYCVYLILMSYVQTWQMCSVQMQVGWKDIHKILCSWELKVWMAREFELLHKLFGGELFRTTKKSIIMDWVFHIKQL